MRTVGRGALHDLLDQYVGEPATEEEDGTPSCERCPFLTPVRSSVVFGSGSSSARIVIVGEFPGQQEDSSGVPFSGDGGKLLMSLLAKAWPDCEELEEIQALSDDDDYYIALRDYLDNYIFWTNLVCCTTPEGRSPLTAEIKACSDRLVRTIYAIDPVLIIATGKLAASRLVGKSVAITNKSGTIFDVSIPSPCGDRKVRYPMMALVAPTWLLKQGDTALISRKKGKTYAAIEDLKYAMELLESYCLKAHGTPFLETST